jgi:hypothetical protein
MIPRAIIWRRRGRQGWLRVRWPIPARGLPFLLDAPATRQNPTLMFHRADLSCSADVLNFLDDA